MRRFLIIMVAIVSLYGCETHMPSADKNTFESNIHQLYGNYTLADIHWPGLPVDLNYDNTGYWDLMYEFQNKDGYYEPDYVANVSDVIVFTREESNAEFAAAFNVTIPYPSFILSDGKWLCKSIRSFQMTIRAAEKTFKLKENCCWLYPGYANHEDLFMANIKDISIFVESFDDDCLKVGIHCTLPTEHTDGTQTLNDNYLYYTFVR